MDQVDEAIVAAWVPQDLMAMPYTPEVGRILCAVRNATGIELSFQELWNRLVDLRDRCEIYAPESDD